MQPQTFTPGNRNGRGRPRGSLNKTTIFQKALEKEGEEIIETMKRMALAANPTAMRLCIERLLPRARKQHTWFALPAIEEQADVGKAISAVLDAVAQGLLSPQEGECVTRIIDLQRRLMEPHDGRL